MYYNQYACDDRLDTGLYMKFLASMSDEEFENYQKERKHLSDEERYEEAVRMFPIDKSLTTE